MSVKEYIESGIIEAYVLGALTETERKEVEAVIAQYPELAEEASAIEDAMIRFAELNAKEPPAQMQEQVWNALQKEAPAVQAEIKTRTIPLVPDNRKQYSWAKAAIWVALLGSLFTNFILLNERKSAENEQLAVLQKLDSAQRQQLQLAQALERYRKASDMIADTAMQTIVMRTMKPGHPMAATIYWSKDKGEAYLSIEKLPPAPLGMQYQMWVIQDGKPVSMGVLPNELIASLGMNKLDMKVNTGQAFAISLEKEGGNPTPTAVYVLGKVSG